MGDGGKGKGEKRSRRQTAPDQVPSPVPEVKNWRGSGGERILCGGEGRGGEARVEFWRNHSPPNRDVGITMEREASPSSPSFPSRSIPLRSRFWSTA